MSARRVMPKAGRTGQPKDLTLVPHACMHGGGGSGGGSGGGGGGAGGVYAPRAVCMGAGLVVPVFSNNVHEIRAYNRGARLARGKFVIFLQVRAVAAAGCAAHGQAQCGLQPAMSPARMRLRCLFRSSLHRGLRVR